MSFRAHLSILAATVVLFTGCADDVTTPAAGPDVAFSIADEAPLPTTGRHIVMFRTNRVPPEFAGQLAVVGGVVERSLDPLGIVVVSGLTDETVGEVARLRGVQLVEPDLIMTLAEPEAVDVIDLADDSPLAHDPSTAFFFPRQWHLRAIQADVAWANGFLGSSDVAVAIVDTGLDYNHASLEGLVDLSRSISLLPDEDALLESLFPGAHPIADLSRHGTHVGATVVSTGEVGAGVTGHTTLFGVKVCRAVGGCPRAAVLEGLMYAADNGADIINLSVGGTFLRSQDRGTWLHLVHRATNYTHQHGALLIVSAGNDAIDMDHNKDEFKIYCNSSNVVCVSATGPTFRQTIDGPWDDFDQPAFFTNYGRSSVDVAAPGGNTNNFVYAACSSFSQLSPGCQASNRFIIGIRGTSMAAPHATGVAALIAAHSPGAKGNPAVIRNRLHQTADRVTGVGNDPYFGKGRVNAARAVGLGVD